MIESAADALLAGGRAESGREHPAMTMVQERTAQLGRTGRDNTTFRAGGLSNGEPSLRIAMIAPLFASLLLVAQNRPPLDSATVTRVLNQLRASDSTVCALAGEALTNYGGFWRGGHGFADPGMPMPQPMPMPMPGGGGGGFHVNMHENTRDMDPAVLRAFRAV